MSEKEKKRRAAYKQNRDKWIFAQSLIIAIITVAIIISSIVTVKLNKSYYIEYKQSGNIDYNVFLKDNEFYEEDYLGENQSYVASLIDKIIADFSYQIEMGTDNVNYHYSYSITSRLEIIDDSSKSPIYNPEYELVKVENKVQNSSTENVSTKNNKRHPGSNFSLVCKHDCISNKEIKKNYNKSQKIRAEK